MSEISLEQPFFCEDLNGPVCTESGPELICRRGSLTIFRQFDATRGAEVVVKRVGLQSPLSRTSSRDQAEQEANIMGLVAHPNLLQCLDFRASEPHAELILEAGSCSLAELVSSRSLSEEEILSYFTQICSGLAALHSRGIAHNDLKAENIIIVDGVAKIADFGDALLLLNAPEAELTRVRGTAGFIAPEVIRGEGCSFASDIWSLGATLYQMVCQERPFASWDSPQIMFQVAKNAPVLQTSVELFDELIARCQQAKPHNRPSAEELLASIP